MEELFKEALTSFIRKEAEELKLPEYISEIKGGIFPSIDFSKPGGYSFSGDMHLCRIYGKKRVLRRDRRYARLLINLGIQNIQDAQDCDKIRTERLSEIFRWWVDFASRHQASIEEGKRAFGIVTINSLLDPLNFHMQKLSVNLMLGKRNYSQSREYVTDIISEPEIIEQQLENLKKYTAMEGPWPRSFNFLERI